MKSADPKSALAGVNVVIPDTVINSVFEDIQKTHPLLAAINFQNTNAIVKMLLSTNGGTAKWGALGDTVSSELSAFHRDRPDGRAADRLHSRRKVHAGAWPHLDGPVCAHYCWPRRWRCSWKSALWTAPARVAYRHGPQAVRRN
jgi:hypothetical protein